MEVKEKYEQERVFREKYKKEKNVIRISNYGKGYTVSFVNNNFINHSEDNRQETYSYDSKVRDGDFCDVIEALTKFSPWFYDKEIILSFGEGAENLPQKEKDTLINIIKNLENLSVSQKNLLSKIDKAKEMFSDDEVFEAKRLH